MKNCEHFLFPVVEMERISISCKKKILKSFARN